MRPALLGWRSRGGSPGKEHFYSHSWPSPRPSSSATNARLVSQPRSPGEIAKRRYRQKNPSDATNKKKNRERSIPQTPAPASTLSISGSLFLPPLVAAEGRLKLLRQFIRENSNPT